MLDLNHDLSLTIKSLPRLANNANNEDKMIEQRSEKQGERPVQKPNWNMHQGRPNYNASIGKTKGNEKDTSIPESGMTNIKVPTSTNIFNNK